MARKKVEKTEAVVKRATINDFDIIIEPLITEKVCLYLKKLTKQHLLLKIMLIRLLLKSN